MSAIRSVISAPKRAFRAIRNHPVKTGLVALAADQASKLAFKTLGTQGIDFYLNRGMVFGQPFEFNTTAHLLYAFTIASFTGLFVKAKSKVAKLSMALILSGTFGNLIDRVAYGGGIDFIEIGSWYPFNLADAAATAGGLLLLCEAFSGPSEKPEGKERPSRLKIVKNSFTRNILNTLGQVFLYTLTFWCLTSYFPPLVPVLALSVIRDLRHRGERMF